MEIFVSVNVLPNYISFLIVSSLSCNFNRLSVPFIFIVHEHRLQEYSKSFKNVVRIIKQYPHFLWVYRRENPRGMLGEHEKSL